MLVLAIDYDYDDENAMDDWSSGSWNTAIAHKLSMGYYYQFNSVAEYYRNAG